MAFLWLIPAVLSGLLLGAHFWRRGAFPWVRWQGEFYWVGLTWDTLGLALSAALVVLVWVPRRWAVRLAQLLLLAGSVEWLRSTVRFVEIRTRLSLPWTRLAVILGAVMVLCLVAALLLEMPAVRRRYQARENLPGGASADAPPT